MAQILKEGKLHYKGKDENDYVIMPCTKAKLVTMEDEKTLEETIANLKSLATGIKFEIEAIEWEESADYEGLVEITIAHNLGIELENFSISFYHQNEAVDLDFKVVDLNSLTIYSDIATDITVAIKQCAEASIPADLVEKVNTNTENIKTKADTDHTHNYATTAHTHTVTDIEDLTIPEVDLSNYYSKEETDKKISKAGFKNDWGKLDKYNDEFINTFLYETEVFSSGNSFVYNNSLFFPENTRNGYGVISQIDLATGTKTQVGTDGIHAANATIVFLNNKLYKLGGSYAPGHGYSWYDSTEFKCYSFETKEWTSLAPYPKETKRHGMCTCNNEVYACGGVWSTNSSDGNSGGLRKYDAENNRWLDLQIAGDPTIGRSCFMFSYENYIYVSFVYYSLKELWKYDIGLETWTKVGDLPLQFQNGHSGVLLGGKYIYFSNTNDADGNLKVVSYDINEGVWDVDTLRYPIPDAKGSVSCVNDGKILLWFDLNRKKQLYNFTPVGSVINERSEVSFTKGSTKDLSRYSGANGQVVINTDTKTIHVMDGSTLGGTPLAKRSDIIEPDLSNYYTKEEVDIISPPKDFGEFIVNGSTVKPPKGYNGEDFAIYTSVSVSNVKYFVVDPYRSGGGTGALYGKSAVVIDASHDFSSKTIGNSGPITTDSEMSSPAMNTVKQLGSTQSMVKKLKSLGFGNVESLDVNNYDKLYNQQMLKASNANIKSLIGKKGQLVVNTDDNTIHVMDGIKAGGHKIGGAKPLLTGINMMEASNEVELVFNNSTTRNFKFVETDGELTKIIDKNNNIEILINKR